MQDRIAGNWLEEALRRLADARVTVFGDFCLDAYWLVDPDESELSVETGLPVRRVRTQRYSPGGAGNVAVNLTALGVREVRAVGLIGDDAFGRLLTGLLQERGVDTAGLLRCQYDWQTMVFAKPHVAGEEQHRIDFGGFNEVRPETAAALAAELDRAAASSTAVILNQQVPAGTSPPHVIERLLEVVAARPRLPFVVDSRHRAELYRGASLKVNAHEAARLCGEPRALTERVPDEAVRRHAAELSRRTGRPVFVTRGERGILAADAAGIEDVPGIQILEQTDPVGAGDTVVAALAAAVGSGADARTAARLANIAASVTVRKLYTTGTATPEEVLSVGPTPDYVYSPELADDPRKARIAEGTEFEIVRDLPAGRQAGLPADLDVRHVIFDHDGTLSTLRQGWEAIMEPMMVRAVLGPRYENADEALYHKVVECVRSYINRTTGVQTLVQMQGLAEMVRRFGCVPEDEVADAHAYKAIYDVELKALVERRTAKMGRGELNAEDFQIKGARAFLERLHAAGLRLYLVSGTDTAEVEAEARALGYAHLFEGGIFGAVGDVRVEAKRIVLDRLIRQEGLGGRRLATFGDGPVEMRETRKREGLAVGVASDEVRRFGLNLAKRSRLIRGGADLIIPDFTQAERLLRFLAVT
jgi:rfaE bifunctional protein kinase chain/domain